MKMKLQKPTCFRGGGKLTLLLLLVFGVAAATEAATSVRVDSVAQRWPWNNKVDIAYTIGGGQELATSNFCKVVFTTVIDGQTFTIDGSTVGASANEGSHKVTWTVPSGLRCTNCTMTAAVYPADVPSGNDYMIIDLGSGAIEYEGLYATQEESNSRYNTALYKTDKLVLRKVPAGTYRTGDNEHFSSTSTTPNLDSWGYNTEKDWNTGRDYYIGVFPVTQRQIIRVYGNRYGGKTAEIAGNIVDHRPTESISWYRVRWSEEGSATYISPTSPVPAVAKANTGTFFQRLNYKTGKYFDLPTEVMWEIAARAGTTTCYYWGSTTNSLPDHVICMENSGASTVAVGSRLPNGWGLYDMIGNVNQMCLDDQVSGSMSGRTDAFTPARATSPNANNANNRRARGNGYYNSSFLSGGYRFYSSIRAQVPIGTTTTQIGFRISHIVD